MANKTIISIYADISTAEKVVDDLTTRGYAREDMGLAVSESSGEALLAVTIDESTLGNVREIIERYEPKQIDTRETGWRQKGGFEALYPGADQFTAVDLAKKRQQK